MNSQQSFQQYSNQITCNHQPVQQYYNKKAVQQCYNQQHAQQNYHQLMYNNYSQPNYNYQYQYSNPNTLWQQPLNNHQLNNQHIPQPISTTNQSDTNSIINESDTEDNSITETTIVEVENQNDFNDMSNTKPKDSLLNPTEISLQEINNNSTLKLGQTFTTFSSFQSTLNKYSKETFQIFSITDCKHLSHNEENSESQDYKYAVFSCYKHLDPNEISKGNKQRGKQNYSGTDCNAYIRVMLKDAGAKKGLYCVTKLNTQHNHSITNAATSQSFIKNWISGCINCRTSN